MKFFGDLGFLDTSKTDPGSSTPAGDGPELVADGSRRQDPPPASEPPSVGSNGAGSNGADSSGANSNGTNHYAAAGRH